MYTIVDISNNNGGKVDWKRVKNAGVTGVLLKATEGATFTDTTFANRRLFAEQAGLRVGYYHFAHPEHNPAKQEAKHFCSVVKSVGRRDFKPVLDFEQGDPHPSYFQWIKDFNEVVRVELGNYPIFYSYPYYIQGLKLPRPVGNGLWLASYKRNDGTDFGATVPAPWVKWDLHQFTSNGTVGGIQGSVDLSHARTLKGLLANP